MPTRRTAKQPKRTDPRVTLSEPQKVNHQLAITGENFPPNAVVEVSLSRSRTSSGITTFKTDPYGTVQVIIMPVAGDQSVTLKCGKISIRTVFTVAE